MFQQFTIPALAFFEQIIMPVFADQATGAQGFNGTLGEFTVMRNVVSSRTIVSISRVQNIMQRRDASCDIVYKNLVGASTRRITTTEIYSAVKFCRNEFYQGCLKEFRAKDPLFGNKILPWFQAAFNIDLTTNAYFGDVDRADNPAAQFSTTIFDGIFKWIKKYRTANIIKADQALAIADGTNFNTTPSAAYAVIKGLWDATDAYPLMKTFTKDQLAYYVSPEIYKGYKEYLKATGNGNVDYIKDVVTGREMPAYDGIRILEEPLWTPVITEIKGAAAYAAVLTVRGNFVFATDDSYGEDNGSGNDVALIVWFDQEHFTWKYMYFMKAGTQIALPEFVFYALSSWA